MIERFRLWLRNWLGIPQDWEQAMHYRIQEAQRVDLIQKEVKELRGEVTRLSVAQYVPPQTPEPERKVIKAQNFRQYLEIIDQEQEALFREEENALR